MLFAATHGQETEGICAIANLLTLLETGVDLRGEAVPMVTDAFDALNPRLIIGESLGAIHAMRIKGIPHLLISPALNAPYFLHVLSWLTCIPGVTFIFDKIYKPREGDRQRLHFTKYVLRKYKDHAHAAYANVPSAGSDDIYYAFIGRRDHYRRTGVVSLRAWKKHFGETFSLYDGTHFTEEEHINALVLPWIYNMLNINK